MKPLASRKPTEFQAVLFLSATFYVFQLVSLSCRERPPSSVGRTLARSAARETAQVSLGRCGGGHEGGVFVAFALRLQVNLRLV